MTIHVVIPDTQVKPGVPTDHLGWIGRYIAEFAKKEEHIEVIHLGDHWDMPSLSKYDKGTRDAEGRRVSDDFEAGNVGFNLIDAPLRKEAARRARKGLPAWDLSKHFIRGNHEFRVERATQDNPALYGSIGYGDMDTLDWQVHDFLEPIFIDGVAYSHYFYNPMSGNPYGGMIETRLKSVGHSFTMGHQQTLLYGMRYTMKGAQHGLVAGAAYLHTENYKGPQGNKHWRGIIVCHEVRDGSYDPMFVSLDFLSRRYEGVGLHEFLGRRIQ